MSQEINFEELKEFLEVKFREFNNPDFIGPDPISIPHLFTQKEDIEIAGFLTAIISWGRREMIIRSARELMERMDDAPFEFIRNASDSEIDELQSFVYRTFQGVDVCFMVKGLRKTYQNDGLEAAMSALPTETDTKNGILRLRETISDIENWPQRTFKHLANPLTGSSAKRLNMFLRWMVRDDAAGVDFGIWKSMKPAQLICPLDVHTGNVARKLGLISRKQNDWKSALELTENLRKMDPSDPVKYDFSLFGLGIYEKF